MLIAYAQVDKMANLVLTLGVIGPPVKRVKTIIVFLSEDVP